MECQRCSNIAEWVYTSPIDGETTKVCSGCKFTWVHYEPIEIGVQKPRCTVIRCVNLAQWALGTHPKSAHCTPCKEANVEDGYNYNYIPLITIAELSDPIRCQKGDLTDALIDFALLKEVKV